MEDSYLEIIPLIGGWKSFKSGSCIVKPSIKSDRVDQSSWGFSTRLVGIHQPPYQRTSNSRDDCAENSRPSFKKSMHAPELDDRTRWKEFALDSLRWIESDASFMDIFLSDESSFHLCGMVNRHSRRILCYENPNVSRKYERDNPKFLRTGRLFSPRRKKILLHCRVQCEWDFWGRFFETQQTVSCLLFCVLCLMLMWWTNYVHPVHRYEGFELRDSDILTFIQDVPGLKLCQTTNYPDTFMIFLSTAKQRDTW